MFSTEEKIDPKSKYFFNTPSALARDLFFYPTIVGSFTYIKDYYKKRLRFDSFLLMFIQSGSMYVKTDKYEGIALPGNVVFIDCYKEHEYKALKNSKVLWFHFDGKMARNYYESFETMTGIIAMPSNPVIIQKSFEDILKGYEEENIVDEAVCSLQIIALLTNLLRKDIAISNDGKKNLRAAASYILENFAKDISIEELARESGLSNYYFCREFKKEIGVSPHQYLIETRISYSKYLLSSTNKTVSEIAELSGFKDFSAFCYTFRKREGLTPGDYKKAK